MALALNNLAALLKAQGCKLKDAKRMTKRAEAILKKTHSNNAQHPDRVAVEGQRASVKAAYARGHRCALCGGGGGEPQLNNNSRLSVCSRCRTVWYCSRECQKAHWKHGGHKDVCVPKG